ncbi:MAG: DUF4398 domain-containing protein [Myxococcota bacterium]
MKAALIPLVLGAVACGGTAVPTSEVADTEAAIRSAQEVGARNVPQAALHLEYAQQHMTKAKEYMSEEEGEPALRALDKAEADANLALEMARSAQARTEAQEALREVNELRKNASVYSRIGDS